MRILLLADEIRRMSVPESLIYALLGFAVTFLGICILIFFVWLIGKILGMISAKQAGKNSGSSPVGSISGQSEIVSDGISEEIKIAIIAEISAYYDGENSSCEFKVKRIKRL